MHLHLILTFICFSSASRYYNHVNSDELHFSNNEKGPRILRHSFFKQHFRLGYKLKLFCQAQGTPLPELQWYKDGIEIQLRPSIRIRNEITMDSVASYLDIDPAGVADAGEYECVAKNSYGYHLQHIRAQFHL